jgi:hypothetical protein
VTTQVCEIVDVQMFGGQEMLNVFHFVDTSGVASEATLVSDYANHVIPLIKIPQTSSLTHTAIRHRLVAPTDELMHTTPISPPVAGGDANTPGDSYVAYSVQFFLGTTVVLSGGFTGHLRRSGCRIPGPTIDSMDANAPPDAGILTAFANWFGQLVNPNGGAWNLCVASFLNGARVRQHTVQSYALIPSCSTPSYSTQNTRKVLRGRVS